MLKVAEALDQMHRLNYIHSNLKLQNVVVKLDDLQNIEKVKLIGFGDVFQYFNMMEITNNRFDHLPPEVIYHLNYIDKNPGHAVERANMLY